MKYKQLLLPTAIGAIIWTSAAAAPALDAQEQKITKLCQQGRALAAKGQQKAAIAFFKKASTDYGYSTQVWKGYGQTLLDAGDLSEAQKAFEELVTLDPQDIFGWYMLAEIQTKKGDLIKAHDFFFRASTPNPVTAQEWIMRGRACIELRLGRKAANAYYNATVLEPKNLEAWHGMAYSYSGYKQFAQAEQAYNHILTLKPDDEKAVKGLAFCLRHQKKYDQAVSLFRRLANREPKKLSLWLDLGSVLEGTGDIKAAQDAYRQAMKADPKNTHGCSMALTDLGDIERHDKNNYAEAEKYYNQAMKLDPKNGYAWSGMGMLKEKEGKDKEAEKILRKSTTLTPYDAVGWVHLAHVLIHQRKWIDAHFALAQAQRCQPDWPDIYNMTGIMHGEQGNFTEAIKAFRVALDKSPTFRPAYINLAGMLQQENDNAGAVDALNKALKLHEDCQALNSLGVSLDKLGKKDEAQKVYKKAIQIDKKCGLAWTNLGNCELEKGQKKAAEQCFRQAVAGQPSLGRAWHSLSELLMERGDKEGAKVALEHAAANIEDPNDLYSVAYSMEKMGERKEARATYTKGLDVLPQEADVILNLKPAAPQSSKDSTHK